MLQEEQNPMGGSQEGGMPGTEAPAGTEGGMGGGMESGMPSPTPAPETGMGGGMPAEGGMDHDHAEGETHEGGEDTGMGGGMPQ